MNGWAGGRDGRLNCALRPRLAVNILRGALRGLPATWIGPEALQITCRARGQTLTRPRPREGGADIEALGEPSRAAPEPGQTAAILEESEGWGRESPPSNADCGLRIVAADREEYVKLLQRARHPRGAKKEDLCAARVYRAWPSRGGEERAPSPAARLGPHAEETPGGFRPEEGP
ncbi:hypothetical protein NDU88_001344 [Pleurodeles waltl]|uniref:Uncharacterized protein n=1 Tax=Pleurodeles waltl TaxID=8319 RepID=A0AAV7TIE2_PLEWA|nr:hypothetical protein NDU88_001344 [Pleurodeles waltl]